MPSRAHKKIATAAAAATLLTLSLSAGTASASTPEPFADQARAAHLTPAQNRALHAEVATYLKRTGGTQTALNVITLPGETIRVAIPGEAHPRDFVNNPALVPATVSSSPCLNMNGSGYFCTWSGTEYTGSEADMYYCNTSYNMPFSGTGSYSNDQTIGVRAKFYGKYGDYLGSSQPALYGQPSYNWYYVWTIVPC
ncbi:hypothetical protein KV557_40465 [Kitasatospora aureofaciens]|uniref:hypothetical protein n=1 Tax=Kitasatospora aureofaciens TaxID=1894 RepID=UPI001C47F7CF|nr:hypothetical protein [Kitasatospora aureofaciens]MBV6703290.1 hypothetical protein [Kitasatospora aureofaciens]